MDPKNYPVGHRLYGKKMWNLAWLRRKEAAIQWWADIRGKPGRSVEVRPEHHLVNCNVITGVLSCALCGDALDRGFDSMVGHIVRKHPEVAGRVHWTATD